MGPAYSSILDDPLLGSRAAGQGAVIIGVSCTVRCAPVQSAAHLSNSGVCKQLAVRIGKYIKTLSVYLAWLDSIKVILRRALSQLLLQRRRMSHGL
jgi:hypothetical protein